MTVSYVIVIITIFASILVFARLGRKTIVLKIANKVALGLLIVFVLYYFFSPQIKSFIHETFAFQTKPDPLEKERRNVLKEIQELLEKK